MKRPVSATRNIEQVKTPLIFFAFELTVIEVTIAALIWALPDYHGVLITAFVGFLFGSMLLVGGLAIWRPEALSGERPLQGLHAEKFAQDVFYSMDGSLLNLDKSERIEAWSICAKAIIPTQDVDPVFTKFCKGVAAKLEKLADLKSRSPDPRGQILTP